MKRIAYRIYNPEEKKFVFSGSTPMMLSGYFKQTATLETVHKMEHQQFTGLSDKSGKEIYEGDIIRTDIDDIIETEKKNYKSSIDRGTVIQDFSPNGYCFSIKWNKGEYPKVGNSSYTIIGNMYENPELLNNHAKL